MIEQIWEVGTEITFLPALGYLLHQSYRKANSAVQMLFFFLAAPVVAFFASPTWPAAVPGLSMWKLCEWLVKTRETPKTKTPAEPTTPVVEPSDSKDPLCTCPKCHMLACHGLKQVKMSLYDIDRETGERDSYMRHFSTYYELDIPRAKRECIFCNHTWTTVGTHRD